MRKGCAKGGGQPAVFLPLLTPSLFPYDRLALKKDSLCKAVFKKHCPHQAFPWGRVAAEPPGEGSEVSAIRAVCILCTKRVFLRAQGSASGAGKEDGESARGVRNLRSWFLTLLAITRPLGAPRRTQKHRLGINQSRCNFYLVQVSVTFAYAVIFASSEDLSASCARIYIFIFGSVPDGRITTTSPTSVT